MILVKLGETYLTSLNRNILSKVEFINILVASECIGTLNSIQLIQIKKSNIILTIIRILEANLLRTIATKIETQEKKKKKTRIIKTKK